MLGEGFDHVKEEACSLSFAMLRIESLRAQ
jgi:hypothetical protein